MNISELNSHLQNELDAKIKGIAEVCKYYPKKYWLSILNMLYKNEAEKIAPRKTFKHFSENLRKDITNLLKYHALRKTSTGRYQSVHAGLWSLEPGTRYEYGQRYCRKYKSTDLYIDYFIAFSSENYKISYFNPITDKYEEINLENVKIWEDSFVSLLPAKHLVCFLEKKMKIAGITWDEKECAFRYKEEIYHIDRKNIIQSYEGAIKIFSSAIKAFKRRRKEKIESDKILKLSKEVFVTREDSINAGNCSIGTENFIKQLRSITGKETIESERGDLILAVRNDQFTRRAINFAIQRTFKSIV